MQSAARARDEKRFCSSAHRQPAAFCVSPFRLMPLPPPLLVRALLPSVLNANKLAFLFPVSYTYGGCSTDICN
jgi:hypothetical protein